mmetsp:Transcript_48643/g.155671  ORF Transcript_48643/g.155671 Transcript_48643/m.155671 type:complete len:276 (+) Transcript_48643:122-949(+)
MGGYCTRMTAWPRTATSPSSPPASSCRVPLPSRGSSTRARSPWESAAPWAPGRPRSCWRSAGRCGTAAASPPSPMTSSPARTGSSCCATRPCPRSASAQCRQAGARMPPSARTSPSTWRPWRSSPRPSARTCWCSSRAGTTSPPTTGEGSGFTAQCGARLSWECRILPSGPLARRPYFVRTQAVLNRRAPSSVSSVGVPPSFPPPPPPPLLHARWRLHCGSHPHSRRRRNAASATAREGRRAQHEDPTCRPALPSAGPTSGADRHGSLTPPSRQP